MGRLARSGALALSVALFAGALFLALDADPGMVLSLELDVPSRNPGTAQVFWRRPGAAIGPAATRAWVVEPGRRTYSVDVPVDVDALRIDPLQRPGRLCVARIALASWGLRFRAWRAGAFDGWRPVHDLAGFEVRDGRLCMESTGKDPYFQIEGLAPRAWRRPWLVAPALGLGLAVALLQRALLLRAAPVAAVAPGAPRARRGTLALAAASTALSVALGIAGYRWFARGNTPEAPVAGAREYGICLVDTAGSPFTDLLGPLKLVLDPFTLYRTFPGQRTPHFSVDANGYRGAFDPADPRPRVLVLGGSAAFGWGLRSDDETFAARLDRLDAGRRYVNGAVTGFLSGQELSEMVHRGDRLPAAGYVVFDGWNEQYVGLFPGYEGRDFGYNRQVFASIEERLRLARRAAGAKLPPATPTPAPLDAQANQREILAAYTRNLRRMAEVARARRAFLLVVFQPQLGTKRRLAGGEAQAIEVWRKAYTRTHAGFAAQYAAQVASAAAFCEREGIACLDLESSPVFRDSENELFVDTVHLNGEGHRLVAREIRSRLARLLGS